MPLILDGTTGISGVDGTAGTPAAQGTDSNTGVFYATDIVGISTGGTERMRIDSSGNVGIGSSSITAIGTGVPTLELKGTSGSFTARSGGIALITQDGTTNKSYIYADTDLYIQNTTATNTRFYTNNTERMRITSDGEVLVGGSTSIDTTGWLSADVDGLSIQSTSGGYLTLFRNDTTVSSGNVIGGIGFYGNDTTSNTPTVLAYIQAAASGTHAAGDNPTDIVFGVTPDASATVAEYMRLGGGGTVPYLRMASGSGGIQFNGDTAAANALDDYEEGTWTPTYVPAAGAFTTITYDALRFGRYTKIGDKVFIECVIRTDAITVGTASGGIAIGGLPFTTVNANPVTSFCVGFSSVFGGDMPDAGLGVANATSFSLIYRTTANGAGATLDVTDLGTGANANLVYVSGFYSV